MVPVRRASSPTRDRLWLVGSGAGEKLDQYGVAQVYGDNSIGTFDQVATCECPP